MITQRYTDDDHTGDRIGYLVAVYDDHTGDRTGYLLAVYDDHTGHCTGYLLAVYDDCSSSVLIIYAKFIDFETQCCRIENSFMHDSRTTRP